MSFLDDEDDGEEDVADMITKKSKPNQKSKEKGKISLFGSKRAKIEEEDTKPTEYLEKRKAKSFGKNPEVNTSFLKDEDKEIQEEITKKKLMNKVNIYYSSTILNQNITNEFSIVYQTARTN